ncbi:MAG: hypothetical protein KAT66_00770 [Candidatus Lokiarchaeota archaeon]|nr:hypothetical protein [Candidatus Lokiarchaeota archaeon]
MKITHLLSNTIVITRLSTVSGNKQAYSTITSVSGHIQPIQDNKLELMDGVFGKTFKIYVDGESEINAGDRLKDEDGNYYTVKSGGVSRRTFGSFDFREIVIEKTD